MARCGIGSWGGHGPNVTEYVRGTGPRGGRLAPKGLPVAYPLEVGHIYRFDTVTEALVSLRRNGRLGALRYASGRIAGFERRCADGGVTLANAIHLFDPVTHLLDEPPPAVTASLWDTLDRGMDDAGGAVVDRGHLREQVGVGYLTPAVAREVMLVGEHATTAADHSSGDVRVHDHPYVRGPHGWQAIEGRVGVIHAEGPEPFRPSMDEVEKSQRR